MHHVDMAKGNRWTVIDPTVLAHMMEHPARGRRWTVRELAQVTGCSAALISHLRTQPRHRIKEELAHRIAEAVGCHVGSLFVPAVSASVDNKSAAA